MDQTTSTADQALDRATAFLAANASPDVMDANVTIAMFGMDHRPDSVALAPRTICMKIGE